ncbi:MAG: MAPEG family protein [Pseudomonadota bacterium]
MLSYSLEIIGVYIGLNLLINFFLAYRVSANRVRSNVLTGTGEDRGLYNANRAHVTNAEYTPIILIGLIGLHLLSGSIYVIHAVGLLLTVGRILHAIGLSTAAEKSSPPRLIGTLMTWLAQIIAAIGCLFYALY